MKNIYQRRMLTFTALWLFQNFQNENDTYGRFVSEGSQHEFASDRFLHNLEPWISEQLGEFLSTIDDRVINNLKLK